MIRADLAAPGKSAGILNAPTLAVVCRFTEVLPVAVNRVLEKRYGQRQKHRNDGQDVFQDAWHLIAYA